MSIGAKATSGFFSFLIRNFLARGLGIVALIILSRKLSPLEFGMVSLTEAILSMIAVFGNTGINEFLQAYTKDDYPEVLKASFWLNILLTLAILLIFLGLAPMYASHEYPQYAKEMVALSFISAGIFVFTQLQIIPKAILGKQLEFKKLVSIQNPFTILIPLGKILCAVYGMGVYSLVVPTLILTPIQTFIFFRSTGLKPSRKLHLEHWPKVYRFTKYLIGSSIIARLTDEGDKFILAKFMNLEAVGVYNLAFQLSSFVGLNITTLTNAILSSVLPQYKNDIDRMRTHYYGFIKVIAMLCFPIIIGMVIFAEPLIISVNGPHWMDAVLPFRILSIYALVRTYTSSYGPVMNTLEMPSRGFAMSLWLAPFHLIGTIIGAMFGAVGVSISVTAVRLVFTNIGIHQVATALKSNFTGFYRNFRSEWFHNFMLVPAGIFFLWFFPEIYWDGPKFDIFGKSIHLALQPDHFRLFFGIPFLIIIYIISGNLFFRKDIKIIAEFLMKSNKKVSRAFNLIYRVKLHP